MVSFIFLEVAKLRRRMITAISLKNFKCFTEIDNINLSKFNILTGINGRGKSSLIQSILLLSQSLDEDGSLNYIKCLGKYVKLGTFKDIKNTESTSDTVSIDYNTDNKIENSIKCSFSEYPLKENLAKITSLKVNDTDFTEKPTTTDQQPTDNSKISLIAGTSTVKGIQQLSNIYFISANRFGPKNYIDKNDILSNEIGIEGENIINVLSSKGKGFTDEVQKELSYILSGASVRTEEIGNIIELYLDSTNDSKGYKPINVGFGYSYILPIIMMGILSKENSILIIENPEAHLHPAAQSRLISFLVKKSKEKNLQVFIETHSDHVINGLRISVKQEEIERGDVSIIHFQRDQDTKEQPKINQITIDNDGNLSSYPEDFMDEWTKQMIQLV